MLPVHIVVVSKVCSIAHLQLRAHHLDMLTVAHVCCYPSRTGGDDYCCATGFVIAQALNACPECIRAV